jgi:hypothetical protein
LPLNLSAANKKYFEARHLLAVRAKFLRTEINRVFCGGLLSFLVFFNDKHRKTPTSEIQEKDKEYAQKEKIYINLKTTFHNPSDHCFLLSFFACR